MLKGQNTLRSVKNSKFKAHRLGGNTRLPQLNAIPDGDIILIRFIRSNRTLDIFGEKFELPNYLIYSYVKAVIITEIHQLQVYLGDDLVTTFEYRLTPQN